MDNTSPRRREHLVVIGNGMAGMRTLEECFERAPDRYDVTVFGAEPRVNYNRILLSPLLAGEKTFDEIVVNGREWYDEHDITLFAGDAVTAIDPEDQTVRSRDGRVIEYDKLLLATGSQPIVIPVPGIRLPGVVTFRDADDVDAMLDASRSSRAAVVIGGGLLGLEAAAGLAARGMTVTVLHLADFLMERQLDKSAAELLKQNLEQRSIEFVTGAETEQILGEYRAEGVRLKDGRTFQADLVVLAIGIQPRATLAGQAGLNVNRGIVVDDGMVTSDPHILAVGECAEHRGVCYGLITPVFEMAKVCAERLAGDANAAYAGSVATTRLKVSGIEVFSAGDFTTPEGEDIVVRDAGRGVYKRLVVQDGRLVGALLYGDAADSAWYAQLLRDGSDVSKFRDTLAFGPAYSEEDLGGGPRNAVALLPGNAEICGCNGVSKNRILEAIDTKDLATVEEVRANTKASSSCGTCSGLVEQLLAYSLGDAYVARQGPAPLCPCTDHPHNDVRRLIRVKSLKSMTAAMQELEWRTADGCHVCRPALNYYLLCAWPAEYVDQAYSRFVNERVHANIQKDGTYSVIPRMWGGITSANELRAIAEVVDKHDIPTVKLTGGQRVDLLGVPKELLPKVWADLNAAGMVSGHAYGKALRTVKTCVGSEWCRFGTQSSMAMGIELEKMTWGSWTPHKFKMAVSGCPRNCAEATIKDFGVVAVESGWELHVGGNGGMKVRAADILCKVTTTDDVKEYCGAFLQMYREEAWYLERTAPWIERVGLSYVRQRMVDDDETRRALFRRFLESQANAQTDPWAERASGKVDAQVFAPLATVEA